MHTNFNRSRLVRTLSGLDITDHAEQKQDFAERLGQWLNVADAITLASILPPSPPPPARPATQSDAIAAARQEYVRRRSAMEQSITDSCSPGSATARIRFPLPKPGTPVDIAASYSPYHRFHLAHQRDMDSAIAPLRTTVRKALASASPALKRLASLDAAFDSILGGREYKALARLPLLLEMRYEHLFKAHQAALREKQMPDDAALWLQPGAWLYGFRLELQATLLAELDIRLQPVAGLIEASGNETEQDT